jgi:NADP-dependent 3-hydroxy acid dehydrogenase YdfG
MPTPDDSTLDRRQLLLGAAATLVAAAGCASDGSDMVARRPPGVPLSPFDAHSTAEAVTAGLDLTGTTALVTGATSGLGFETLRVLAMRGAHVIATGRTLERAREAIRDAGAAGRSTPLALDLADWQGVAETATAVRAMGRPIDMLICNAGIMTPVELGLVHGVEQQFAVNHLGHVVLCHHQIDAVKAARRGRVVGGASQ